MVVLLLALLPVPVAAHASLIGTDPADGAELDGAPESVTLSFTEPVEPVEGGFRLFDASGQVATLEAEVIGADVVVALPGDLPDGGYVVGWRVVSMDSHPIRGVVTFTAGNVGAAPVDVPESRDIAPVLGVVQGIGYIALLGAAGLVLFGLVTGEDRRNRPLVLLLGGVAVVVHILLIPLTRINETGMGLGEVFRASAWRVGIDAPEVGAAVLVAVGLGTAVGATLTGGRRRVAGILTGVLAAIASLSLVGHTRTVEPAGMMYATDIAHGVATATWFGGLVGLARYLGTEARSKPVEGAKVVSRFSDLAGIAFLAALFAGNYMAFQIIGSREALMETTYGRLLLAKATVLLVPLGLATWNRLALVPAVEREPDAVPAWRRLRSVVLIEAAALVVVVGITGFLVGQSPNVEGGSVSAAEAGAPFEETVAFDGGSALVRIEPGGAGENEVVIEIRDGDGEPVELPDDPVIELVLPSQELGPLTSTLAPTEIPGQYSGTVLIPLPGEWELSVVMRVSRFEQTTATVTVVIP